MPIFTVSDKGIQVYTLDERPDLRAELDRINRPAWPEFMFHSEYLDWESLFGVFAAYQLLLCDAAGDLVAFGHTAPFEWNGTRPDLPATMAQIIERAHTTRASGSRPNTFSALAAVVAPEQKNRGLSTAVIQAMRSLAAHHGCTSLVAPVRPPWKAHYPLIPMEEYVAWIRPDGAPFDPWIRVHWRLGATFLGVEPATMTITGTRADWEHWTGMALPVSGAYVVPGALQPVVMDLTADQGRYEDPNVWMWHAIAGS
jgi:hypothetical protein